MEKKIKKSAFTMVQELPGKTALNRANNYRNVLSVVSNLLTLHVFSQMNYGSNIFHTKPFLKFFILF